MNILVTGTAGFIGSYLAEKLSVLGHNIVGIDSINNYYDTELKINRLKKGGITEIKEEKENRSLLYPNYCFLKIDLCNKDKLQELFSSYHFDLVVNLAAQAGVRYSLINPQAYIDSNINGFLHILECCVNHNIPKLVYASSSSIYGNTTPVPFKESAQTDKPVSLYAATKKSNELMAYTYSHLYGIETIGLRFFTVYGPYGRPDMAPMLFADAINHNKPITVFNNGNLARDFTYIDDIIEGITRICETSGKVKENTEQVPAAVYNIGHGNPVQLMDFINLLEKNLGKEVIKKYTGMQPGDVYQTWADTTKLKQDFGYNPSTPLEKGIKHFAEWYKQYYSIN
ncbi:MAG: NAD-dependent epimerase/dehydratase family protein [Odoribacter sp.]|nr:NAD-dependent epimerase/dehydratase family protein [Odoribacter sp.]